MAYRGVQLIPNIYNKRSSRPTEYTKVTTEELSHPNRLTYMVFCRWYHTWRPHDKRFPQHGLPSGRNPSSPFHI